MGSKRPIPFLALFSIIALTPVFADRFGSHAHQHQAALMADTKGARTNFVDAKDAWVCIETSMYELKRLNRLKFLCRGAVPTESLTQAISFLKADAASQSIKDSEILEQAARAVRAYREAALRLDEADALSRLNALDRTVRSAKK